MILSFFLLLLSYWSLRPSLSDIIYTVTISHMLCSFISVSVLGEWEGLGRERKAVSDTATQTLGTWELLLSR